MYLVAATGSTSRYDRYVKFNARGTVACTAFIR
jgi:hypothetical protein